MQIRISTQPCIGLRYTADIACVEFKVMSLKVSPADLTLGLHSDHICMTLGVILLTY